MSTIKMTTVHRDGRIRVRGGRVDREMLILGQAGREEITHGRAMTSGLTTTGNIKTKLEEK